MQLKDAAIMISGAASGLGEAAARYLAAQGARPLLLDLNAEGLARVGSELSAPHAALDVCDAEAVSQALEGFGRIDGLVNCAGIAPGSRVLSSRGVHSLELFQKVIAINLVGSFNVARLAAEKMAQNPPNAEGERGVIIHTTSVAAFEGQVGQAAYSASKGGLVGMTLPMARELARHGIRVMAVAPGILKTAMLEAMPEAVQQNLAATALFPSRLGKPEEFAQLIASIFTNPLLNGSTIRLDGAVRLPPR